MAENKSRTSTIVLIVSTLILAWIVWQVTLHWNFSAAATNLPPISHTEVLGEAAFTVNAGTLHSYKVSVPAGAYGVNLKGHFSATGGKGSDIEVFVFNQDGYTNWQNGHQARTFYSSGKVTQDTLNLNLPAQPGYYYVVFSNKFSLISQKAVQAHLNVTFFTPRT
jgi:hypothetical protein